MGENERIADHNSAIEALVVIAGMVDLGDGMHDDADIVAGVERIVAERDRLRADTTLWGSLLAEITTVLAPERSLGWPELPALVGEVVAERNEFRDLCGKHDPTGEDHMHEMMEHANRADAAEAENARLRAVVEAAKLLAGRLTRRAEEVVAERDRLRAVVEDQERALASVALELLAAQDTADQLAADRLDVRGDIGGRATPEGDEFGPWFDQSAAEARGRARDAGHQGEESKPLRRLRQLGEQHAADSAPTDEAVAAAYERARAKVGDEALSRYLRVLAAMPDLAAEELHEWQSGTLEDRLAVLGDAGRQDEDDQ